MASSGLSGVWTALQAAESANSLAGVWAALGGTVQQSEPIESRAEEYKSPGDNSSPAGETIAAIIGTASFDGKIVWWGDFKIIDNKVTASWAMVFADGLFTPSAELLKLYTDEQLLISNVAPTTQTGQNIRFYDGSQTAVDPLLTERLGADHATAWPGFIYAVFEDFDCGAYGNRVPLIRAVLSGAVTDAPAIEEQSTLNFGAISGSNGHFTVDHIRNHHYQIVNNGTDVSYVLTIDIATLEEINRVQVFGIADFTAVTHPVALYGTDYIACSIGFLGGEATVRPALLNIQTGELVASLPVQESEFSIVHWLLSPRRATLLQSTTATKFIVATVPRAVLDPYGSGSMLGIFVANTTDETLEYIIHPLSAPAVGGPESEPQSVEFGPVVGGVASVWYTDGHTSEEGAVNLALVKSNGFTAGPFYVEPESGKAPKGVAYDSVNGRLIVYRADGSFIKLNATTGALVSTHAGSITDFRINVWVDDPSGAPAYDALYQKDRPGYVVAARGSLGGIAAGDIYEINLSTLEATLLLDQQDFSNDDVAKFFNHVAGVQTEGSDTAGIINKVTLSSVTPDTVDLEDIFLQLATFDDRFESSDLDFSGFPGNETSGLKLENDTTVDNLERSIAELFDVKIVPSDGTRKYFYPQRDGSFAVTATIAEVDFVERGSQTIEKTFGAGEDEFLGCSVSYFDVDADYKRLEQSYVRPVGLYDVTRSKKKRTVNTVLSLTASQAKQLATLFVYRSVLGNETYAAALTPGKSHLEPADILQFDFRGFTVYGRVKEATLHADYTQDVTLYQYLQYADGTFTGAQLGTPEEVVWSTAVRLIYLDLPLISYSHDLGGDGLVQYVQLAGYGPGIINATAFQSGDGRNFYSVGIRSEIAPVVGVITSISGTPDDPFIKDTSNSISVVINAGDIADLETITDSEFENAVQMAAIGRPGRWVLLLFQTVSSLDGTATLSDLLWGYHGSEVWIDELQTGDLFVLLDPDWYNRYTNQTTLLDTTLYFKGAKLFTPLGSVQTEAYVATGVAETPYAPTSLDAVVDGSDIDLTWDYRSRLTAGINPADHGEVSLSFEIDIIGTGSPEVLRTLTATTNSKTYLAADIATDFGGVPGEITFRVYMMSALVGRGYVGTTTSPIPLTLRFDFEDGDDYDFEDGDPKGFED